MSKDITISVNGEDGTVVSRNAGIRLVGEDALVRVWPPSPKFVTSWNQIEHDPKPFQVSLNNFSAREMGYMAIGHKSPFFTNWPQKTSMTHFSERLLTAYLQIVRKSCILRFTECLM